MAGLTVAETCEKLRCGRTTVTKYIHSGALVASKVGGKWLISEDAIADLLEARSNRPRRRRARG